MNDLNTWFKGRPEWLQEAASLLLKKGRLVDEDIDVLLNKCFGEVDGENILTNSPFPSDAFNTQSAFA